MEWSAGHIVVAFVLVGVPVLLVASGARHVVRGVRASRDSRRRERAREALRRPGPDTMTVEGRVVPADEVRRVVTRRQYGCLGGPIVYDVSAFELELDDGTRWRVEVGPDPVVERAELLAPDKEWASSHRVPTTADPMAVAILDGRVRVAGVVPASEGTLAPPPQYSATVTFLA